MHPVEARQVAGDADRAVDADHDARRPGDLVVGARHRVAELRHGHLGHRRSRVAAIVSSLSPPSRAPTSIGKAARTAATSGSSGAQVVVSDMDAILAARRRGRTARSATRPRFGSGLPGDRLRRHHARRPQRGDVVGDRPEPARISSVCSPASTPGPAGPPPLTRTIGPQRRCVPKRACVHSGEKSLASTCGWWAKNGPGVDASARTPATPAATMRSSHSAAGRVAEQLGAARRRQLAVVGRAGRRPWRSARRRRGRAHRAPSSSAATRRRRRRRGTASRRRCGRGGSRRAARSARRPATGAPACPA